MYTTEQFHEVMNFDRQGILALIDESPSITLLPAEKQGKYLIGTAKNNRAVCLVWEEEGRVNGDIFRQAFEEVAHAGLCIPFLFFCRTSFISAPHTFACMQIPYVFEYGEIVPTLRTLNFRGKPKLAIVRE